MYVFKYMFVYIYKSSIYTCVRSSYQKPTTKNASAASVAEASAVAGASASGGTVAWKSQPLLRGQRQRD